MEKLSTDTQSVFKRDVHNHNTRNANNNLHLYFNKKKWYNEIREKVR